MLNSSTLWQASLTSSVLSVTWILRSAVHRKDIFWYPAPTLVQSEERIPEMCFLLTAERRDFETHITDQTVVSVLAVRMWSSLTLWQSVNHLQSLSLKCISLLACKPFSFYCHFLGPSQHLVTILQNMFGCYGLQSDRSDCKRWKSIFNQHWLIQLL